MNPQPDQDTTQGQKNTVEQPVLGVAVTGSPDMPKRPVRLLLVVGVVLVGAVIAGGVLLSRPKIYGQVGDYKVTKAELDKTLAGAVEVSSEKAVSALLDRELYRKVGKEQKMSVTQQDIEVEYKKRTGGKSVASEAYVRVAVERDIYKKKLTEEVRGYQKGRFVLARFDQHIVSLSIPIPADDKPQSEEQAKQLIAKDREYAVNLTKGIYEKLLSKQINFDQAIEIQKNDPILGTVKSASSPQSGAFDVGGGDPEELINQILKQKDPATLLAGLKPGEFTQPFVGQVAISEVKNPPMTDGNMVILQLDSVSSKNEALKKFKSIDDLTKFYKEQLHYRIIK